MNIPHVWLDMMWTDTDVLSARSGIEAAYNALKHFDDEWTDLPSSLHEALRDLEKIMRYYEQRDKETERQRLAEWQALAQVEVAHVH